MRLIRSRRTAPGRLLLLACLLSLSAEAARAQEVPLVCWVFCYEERRDGRRWCSEILSFQARHTTCGRMGLSYYSYCLKAHGQEHPGLVAHTRADLAALQRRRRELCGLGL